MQLYRLLVPVVLVIGAAINASAAEVTISQDCRNAGCPIPEGAERVIFEGNLSKQKTTDRRVLGVSAFLNNSTNADYRIVKFDYSLDTSGIKKGETVETDIGFSAFQIGMKNSLTSGEELLITHQYDAGPAPVVEKSLDIPGGGLALPAGHALNVGSTSGFFMPGRGVKEIDDARLSDGQLMALHYRVELIRADLVSLPGAVSYRSPYRDRSYVADGNRRYAPFTDFVNTSGRDVKIYGSGIFLSNLTSVEKSAHQIEVSVNGQVVETIETPDHIPGNASPPIPLIVPYDITLKPNDRLSVRAKLSTRKAIVFDFAAFIIGEPGLEPTQERLDAASADLNGDGYTDIIDVDAKGTLWVSLRVGRGLQDTQQPWINRLGDIDTLEPWKDGDKTIGLIARNSNGLCLHLKTRLSTMSFVPGYCNQEIGDISGTEIWGDFNGDGWPDRVQINKETLQYMVSLGSKDGLRPPTPWINGFGGVEKLFAFDGDEDGKTDLLTEWSDATGFRCLVWQSDGHQFNGKECP
ncbi:VCBS repeat-containing protein [Rhizobium sp. YK2]|uniref:FG-GAP repeat domain-containing protein n=1 Tax=Rhizobium sp. YK2 TaxID=1860096 RepID=UPI00084BCEDF|nr:VCBS repeat-containing protein [Rhizobium sp. YK2]OEC99673.1 hypothetical protein A9Z06_17130 [Rhizobium sp. YK2]